MNAASSIAGPAAMPPVFGVLFDGFAYGMLLFLLSVGLSVTLGMMNFVNLAHCSFAMLGGYVTVTLMNALGWPFFATLPVAFIAAAAASVVLERVFFRRLYRASELDQCLLTIGIVFISVAAAAYIYGTAKQPVQLPSYLRGSIAFMGSNLAVYRMFLIATALLITSVLVVALEYTRFGAQVRAAVEQSAHGARPRHQRRPAVRHHLRARQRACRSRRRARHRDRRPRSLVRLHLSGLRPDRGRRSAVSARSRDRLPPPCCSASATWPANITFPPLGAFLIYLVMIVL